jgi:hypothetical protein
MGRTAHDCESTYRTTRPAEHEPEPLGTRGKLGKIMDIRPPVFALLADYLARAVDVKRGRIAIKDSHHGLEETRPIEVVVVTNGNEIALRCANPFVEIAGNAEIRGVAMIAQS